MISALARATVVVLGVVGADAGLAAAYVFSGATCCISSAETCPGTACSMPNVGGDCPLAAQSADCGAPFYCSFDGTLGCLTTNQCSAAKLKAVGKATRRTLRCDSEADAKGVAVNPTCTSKALGALPGAFSLANATGPCPGSATTLQNDIHTFESNGNAAVGNAGVTRTASTCDSKKVAAMGTATARFLACMSKTARTAASPFGCIIGAGHAFDNAVAKANSGGGCSSSKTSGDLEDEAVDPFETTVADHLASPSGAFLGAAERF